MSKINSLWEELQGMLRGYVVGLLEVDGSGRFRNPQGNDNGHAYVVFPSGATAPLPDGAATETTLAAILELGAAPSTHTAITAADATDVTAIANVGVYIGGAGNLAYRTAGAPTTTVTLAVVAGQFVWGQFTRVMTATTATGIVGVKR